MAIQRRELRELIHDLQAIPPGEVREELRPAVRAGAGIVAEEARRNASWSARIPPAVSVSARFTGGRTAGARVVVNERRAPHARYFENNGAPGVFYHPLWGNRRHWYPEAARPFLAPALETKADEAADIIGEAVDEVLRRRGFR